MNATINENVILTEQKAKLSLILLFFTLIGSSFLLIPYSDAYYYWDWSRHLALSYYDGSPLIAYMMRLFSLIFGNTALSINFLGIASIYATLFFIYKTAELLFNKRIALNACVLFVFSSLVIHYLFIWVTYDNPLNLFWAAIVYFVVRFIQNRNSSDLYWIGAGIGFLILSKYTGIVLILALALFILCLPRYWFLLKNKHFYFSLVLAGLIASPVFIWNYQHDWVSFLYQMTAHKNHDTVREGVFKYLFMIITRYNILLFLPIYALFKSFKAIKENDSLLFLNVVTFTFALFFFYQSFSNNVSKHLVIPYCITSAILCSYYFAKYNLRKLFIATLIVYFVWSLDYIISYSFFQKYIDGNVVGYSLAKQAGEKYLTPDKILVTSNWDSAAKLLFWIPGRPQMYTLPCGGQNQYAYWSKPIVEKMKQKQIKQALYLDFDDHSMCIKEHFAHCERLPSLTQENKHFRIKRGQKVELFIYQCEV